MSLLLEPGLWCLIAGGVLFATALIGSFASISSDSVAGGLAYGSGLSTVAGAALLVGHYGVRVVPWAGIEFLAAVAAFGFFRCLQGLLARRAGRASRLHPGAVHRLESKKPKSEPPLPVA